MLLLVSSLAFSQTDQRIAKSRTPLSAVERYVLPPQDNDALLEAELARRGPGIAPRFAVNLETDISPKTHGDWEYLSNGNALWRLRIFSKGARSLNLGFTTYDMPPGGTLLIYSPDKKRVMGPFTPADNEQHAQLWTPVLDGDELVLEVQLPRSQTDNLELELKYVNHDFLGFTEVASGSCNLDVICGAADGWAIVDDYRDIIQSVAAISTGGSAFCTGFLINNGRQDCTPYFMTANHCGINNGNAASLVTYWNFINNYCRQPNSPESGGIGNGSLANFNTGAFWRAGWADSDFTLVELDDPVATAANAYFAGWSAENIATSDTTITIHHPSGDEKRISFEFDDTYFGDWGGGNPPPVNPDGTHLIVPDWDIGTTEGGSSGAPIFNKLGQVVGQLHGGAASCSNDLYDSFGRFASSWEGGGSPTTRLKDWLDPDNLGIESIGGRSAIQCSFFVNATPTDVDICAPDDVQLIVAVSTFFGSDVELSVTGLPAALTTTFDTNPVAPGDTTLLTISNTGALSSGIYLFNVTGTDGTDSNFTTITLTLSAGLPASPMLNTPADGEMSAALLPTLTWDALPVATYDLELATDADFTNIVLSTTGLELNQYPVPMQLQPLQQYFWRIRATNLCGQGDWSVVYSFSTAATFCSTHPAEDVPVPIPQVGTPVITSTINVTIDGIIDDVNVRDVEINHTWISDLRIELTSPQGTTILLMNNPNSGSCPENDIDVSFDDQSPNPYFILNSMCDPFPPALSGNFQPFMPLSAFAGEQALGEWVLTIYDNADLDGGELNNWELEICTIVPNNFSVTAEIGEGLESCIGSEVSFAILLGSGFDAATGVSLSTNGLPAGAMATFSPNPAMPGTQVEVALAAGSDTGVFDFEIVADDGTNTGSTTIQWTVTGPPDTPVPTTPGQGQTDVPLLAEVSWSSVASDGYEVVFSTNPDFTDSVFVAITTIENSVVVPVFNYCTTYYWRVVAFNECGSSDVSETFSFTTEDDLSFAAPQPNFFVCNTGVVVATVEVGDCFGADGLSLTADSLPAGATVAFFPNPVFSNETAEVEISLVDVVPNTYALTINGTDGTNHVSTTLNMQVGAPAGLATLQMPPNDATNVPVEPQLSWDTVSNATSYQVELATDNDFNNVVYETTLTQTTLTVPVMLEPLTTYYWRITAINDCGATTSTPFSFTTEMVEATVQLDGLHLHIMPNPTDGLLRIVSTTPPGRPIALKVYSINGIALVEKTMSGGEVLTTLDLSAFPAGVYLVRLVSGRAVGTERIILK